MEKMIELNNEQLEQVAAGEYEQEIVAELWRQINRQLADLRMAVLSGCIQYADQMLPIYEAYNRRSAADVKSAANALEACIRRGEGTLTARCLCSQVAKLAEQIMTY